jgi:hypothetical protein
MHIPGLRSPYDQIGGLVYFGRMLDKIRLHAAGKLPGDYQSNLGTGFDGRCTKLLKVEYAGLVARVKQGGSDEEIFEWCCSNGSRLDEEATEVWNDFMRKRGWRDDVAEILERRLRDAGAEGKAQTMFDYIDLDEGRPPHSSPG